LKFRTIIFFLILFTFKISATECITTEFRHKHLFFQLCQNHSNYNETTVLLYKARAIQLNKFIEDLIAQGKLKDKVFVIELYDPVLTWDHLHVTQSEHVCHIDGSGFLNFEMLARLVNYFTQPEWHSYIYDYDTTRDLGKIRETFETLIEKFPLPDLSAYTTEKISLWELDNYTLAYHDDKVSYFSSGTAMPYSPSSNLPVKIRDRYLFFLYDSIYVLQNRAVIFSYSIPNPQSDDFSVDVYDKWVNIGWGGDNVFYSYSYMKNVFYDVRGK